MSSKIVPAAAAWLVLAACADADLSQGPTDIMPRADTRTDVGSKIAYSSDLNDPAGSELYVMNPDGSGQRKLTETSGNSNGPSWSPNGGKIAYHSNQQGGTDIYVMNADGSDVTRLTYLTALGVSAHFATWSPDGQRVLFNSFVQPRDIYVINIDGTGLVNLTNHASDDIRPDWSPDGRKIVFRSTRDGNEEIYLMDPDGSDVKRLTFSAGVDTNPEWSPNGRRIVFESRRDGNPEIYVMNADGTDPVRLTTDAAIDTKPSWSPDGHRIAFHRQVLGHFQVFTMNADGSEVTRLTNLSNEWYSGFPSWGRGSATGDR